MKSQHDRGRRDGDFVISTPTELEYELPFQLHGAGYNFYQYPVERPFGLPFYQWIQTIEGEGTLEIDEGKYVVGPFEGMLLYPGEFHQYHALSDSWHVHWITFTGSRVLGMLDYVGMKKMGVYHLSHPGSVALLIQNSLQVLKSEDPLRRVDGSALVYSLLLEFLKYCKQDKDTSHSDTLRRIQPALDFIEQKIHAPLSLTDLADSIGVTPQYFCELFKSATRQRPMEYINQRRIDRAKEMICCEPHTKMHDIAVRVGFQTESYFGVVFRRLEGMSPGEYRGR